QSGAGGIRSQIIDACGQLFKQAALSPSSIQGCGLGFGGPVDDRTQQTITSHQVSGWDNFPLSKWALETLGIPSIIGNDADVSGLAEAACGAGQGCNPVFYMNIGSGIGGALILEGKIHRGTGVGAGEIGHLWIDYEVDAWKLGADTWSILEHRSSGWALQKAAGQPDVLALLKAVQGGDTSAQQVWVRARRRLAVALSHVIALVCPQRIVLGGGVSLAPAELFLNPLREEVAQIVFKPFAGCYDIQAAGLGEMVVVQGALALARQQFN
ncbi:MAG TPA: ROK family protein, partial [Gemmatales bacterium]|nr:ROK family protein [Gemmatales bacterium]